MSETAVPAYLERLLRGSGGGAPPVLPPPLDYVPPRAALVEIPFPVPAEKLDPDAVRIVRRLVEGGFAAYLVGGCVRDLLFGLKPKDFDIATSATPRDIRRLFRNCRIIGRRFRLAHVFFRDKVIEVATFRAASAPAAADEPILPGNDDAAPQDGGVAGDDAVLPALDAEFDAGLDDGSDGAGDSGFDPASVAEADAEAAAAAEAEAARAAGALIIRDDNVFGTAEEDAVRRDFTVNALFYDVDRQVILDYVGGVEDAEKRQIRTIGDPRIRMREDPIRILRAIRLAARMGCGIHPATWEAIEVFRHEILHAAAPRIGEDILRMFRGGAILPAVDMMLGCGVLEVLVPELHAHLARAVAAGNAGEVEALRATLRVADAKAQAGQALSSAVQLTVLLAPVLMTPAEAAPEESGDDAPARRGAPARPVRVEEIGERLRPIAQRIAISRRDAERMRLLLQTLPRLLPTPPGRKRRAPGTLLRRAFLPEAVDLFEVFALATGDGIDEVARWRHAIAEAFPDGPPAERPAPRGRPQGGRGGDRRRPRRR